MSQETNKQTNKQTVRPEAFRKHAETIISLSFCGPRRIYMKTLCKEYNVLALYSVADLMLQNVQRSKYGWHQFGTLILHIL